MRKLINKYINVEEVAITKSLSGGNNLILKFQACVQKFWRMSLATGFILFQFEIFPDYRNASKCSKYGGYAVQGGGANNIE